MNRWICAMVLFVGVSVTQGAGLMDINRVPDGVSVVTDDAAFELAKTGNEWTQDGITVGAAEQATLNAPKAGVKKIVLTSSGFAAGDLIC